MDEIERAAGSEQGTIPTAISSALIGLWRMKGEKKKVKKQTEVKRTG
jgi:hypothetical protein